MRSIYVIGSDPTGPLKIGHAGNPDHRCRVLQTGHPHPLGVLWQHKTASAQKIEHLVHLAFREKRLSGEWFDVQLAAATDMIERAMRGDLDIPKPDYSTSAPWLSPHGDCPSCDKRRAALQATMRKRRAAKP